MSGPPVSAEEFQSVLQALRGNPDPHRSQFTNLRGDPGLYDPNDAPLGTPLIGGIDNSKYGAAFSAREGDAQRHYTEANQRPPAGSLDPVTEPFVGPVRGGVPGVPPHSGADLSAPHQAAVLRAAGHPPPGPHLSNDQAASQLAGLAGGFRAMRNDGPGEAAARQLGAMNPRAMAPKPSIDDAIAARVAQDQRGDAANAIVGASGAATAAPPAMSGNVDELQDLVNQMKASRQRGDRGEVGARSKQIFLREDRKGGEARNG